MVIEGKPVWVKRSRHNHYLDCEALCAAIGYTMNVQRIPEGVERVPKREAAVPGGHDGTQVDGGEVQAPPPTSHGTRLCRILCLTRFVRPSGSGLRT